MQENQESQSFQISEQQKQNQNEQTTQQTIEKTKQQMQIVQDKHQTQQKNDQNGKTNQQNKEDTKQQSDKQKDENKESKQQKIQENKIEQKNQKKDQSPEAIRLVHDNSTIAQNQDLNKQQPVKEVKPSKRLAKFKQKNKKQEKKLKQEQNQPKQQQVPNKPQNHKQSLPQKSPIQQIVIQPKQIQQQQFQLDDQGFDQSSMLSMIISSKKQQNFNSFKQWNDKRSVQMSFHYNLVDGLQRSLDKTARISFDNIQIYSSTFKQIQHQHQKYASYPRTDISSLTNNNQVSKNIYINCSCLLNVLNQQNNERLKKAQLFSNHILNKILKNVLDIHIKKYHQLVSNIKSRISKNKSTLVNLQLDLESKGVTLINYIDHHMTDVEKWKQFNLYYNQRLFIKLADDIVILQKQYAQLVLEYYGVVKTMEIQRSNVIKESIKIYSEGLRDIYQSKTGEETLQQLKKSEEESFIQQFYSLQKFIALPLQQTIKQKIKQSQNQFNFKLLESYFVGFSIVKFDVRQIILKQYQVIDSQKVNHVLLITVDKFINILNGSQGYASSIKSYHIDQHLALKRKNNQIEFGKVSEKKTAVFGMLGWTAKPQDSSVLIFSRKDHAQQVQDFVKKLI